MTEYGTSTGPVRDQYGTSTEPSTGPVRHRVRDQYGSEYGTST